MNHESLIDEEVTALKLAAVVDHLLQKMDHDEREKLPPITPTIGPEFVNLDAGPTFHVAVPIWWLLDGDDWLVPDLETHTEAEQ